MLIINNWIGADPDADTMHYIDVDWHGSKKHGDGWELTFSVNDGNYPRFGCVIVHNEDINGSYGSRQIVPGCAIRRRGGEWVLRYLTINGTDYTVADAEVSPAMPETPYGTFEIEAYFTNDMRTLDDGTVERSFWVRSGEFGRDYYWVRYPRGVEPKELREAPEVMLKFRLTQHHEVQQANSAGFLLTGDGEYEIVTDEPQHKLTRAL